MKKIVFLITAILMFSNYISAQTIEKNFLGWWGDTFWEFHFKKNGRYERISSGHFGFTTTKGRYKIENDTIEIISGSEKSYGTISDKYIIDENDVLIDVKRGYGHKRISSTEIQEGMTFHTLLYPEIQPVNKEVITDIEEVLNLAFNSNKVKSYYHFDSDLTREFAFVNYLKLKANIKVDDRKAIFKDKKDITEKFYIEFEKIERFYNRINFTFKIPIEGVKINCYFEKKNGEWKEDLITITEN